MKKIYTTLFILFTVYLVNAQCTNNWANPLTDHSGIQIGNLNVTGNKITVEAVFNRTAAFNDGGMLYEGDIVSKHNNPSDCNYLLRPDDAEITTSAGYFRTPGICDITTNKTYYVAMVYDGDSLKFYRNGFEMSSVAATGNLFQNNWITNIGSLASEKSTPYSETLFGYINEVRIWNVVRTQAQLRQYMNKPLPNPTAQTGLLAYYELNSLTNLQGNAAWNGSVSGSVNISQSNPTCSSFAADSCEIVPGTVCSNDWLATPSYPTYVDIGQLNVTGNQITVEAEINRTQPYADGTGDNNDGDIVSKHLDPSNTNYLLRLNHAYFTNTAGQFFATPDVCDAELNKTYHVAMVYDGATLKYYRNGFLMSQIAASGNLYQNTFPARIGLYSGSVVENFLGYITEVRIWNVARTQAQLRQYMNTSLPNPTTQTGLLAYYNFSSLNNLQGNAAWNGTLTGSASIGQINPTCEGFVADSCGVQVMPLTLRNFQGSITNHSANLSWTTFDEVNTASDFAERSYDGTDFSVIGSLPAKGSLQQNVYQFTDQPSFANAKVFYRIKFVDKDGKYTYSNILVLQLNTPSLNGLKLFPNPAKTFVQLTYTSIKDETTIIKVTDISGKIIIMQPCITNKGVNSVDVNFANKFSHGTYIVQLIVNGKNQVSKLVVD
jgi:hypothetical protein